MSDSTTGNWLQNAWSRTTSLIPSQINRLVSSYTGEMVGSQFNNDGTQALRVPGFGLAIDYMPSTGRRDTRGSVGARFCHGFNDFRPDRLTAREVSMLRIMNALTDKQSWNRKVFDKELIAKWRQEAASKPLFSDKTFEWCIEELQWKAGLFEQTAYVKIMDGGNTCVKSDTLVDDVVKKQLNEAVAPLLSDPDGDWHPNSNDQVLNLVHPSLFPLVYGRSRVLVDGAIGLTDCLDACGKGNIAPAGQTVALRRSGRGYVAFVEHANQWSTRFQWLPCEVRFVGDEGTKVEITSYINNLHPIRDKKVYQVIESLLSRSIRPWSEVLLRGSGRSTTSKRIDVNEAKFNVEISDWIHALSREHHLDPEQIQKVNDWLALPDNPSVLRGLDPAANVDIPEDWDTDTEWSVGHVAHHKWRRMRRVAHPEPGDSCSFDEWKGQQIGLDQTGLLSGNAATDKSEIRNRTSLETEFRSQGLQVIIKLASIELCPERPRYEGGNWHLEGCLNEHIVATAIYYYDVENVTESRISFRQEAYLDSVHMRYEQDDHWPLMELFGTDDLTNEPAVQEIGSVATPEGRLLVFPNTLQHRVNPFKLLDESRNGHRRFVVMWLVDPNFRIMSTANVPPQRGDWWKTEPAKVLAPRLPAEISKMVMDDLEWPMYLDEAKKLRLDLMKERTKITDDVDSNLDVYNFCEH